MMMKCGHEANAIGIKTNKPCCAVCIPKEGYDVPMEEKVNLIGRKSRCFQCNSWEDSKETLPFFKHQAEKTYDSHYCGCRGWD